MKFRRERLPPASTFYRAEFGKSLGRPARNWARTRCRFHHGDNPYSFCVNLQSGGYYCHSCGARGGDIVSYIMQRDHITFKDACVLLNCWDEATTITAQQAALHRQEKERERAELAEQEARECQLRIAARDHLLATEELYREAIEANDWQLMAEFLPLFRAAENRYCQLASLEVPYGE